MWGSRRSVLETTPEFGGARSGSADGRRSGATSMNKEQKKFLRAFGVISEASGGRRVYLSKSVEGSGLFGCPGNQQLAIVRTNRSGPTMNCWVD